MKMRVGMSEREIQRTRDRENIVGISMQRHEERESKRAREQESKRARERESERARERESERARDRESERARERKSGRARERESERAREQESERAREPEREGKRKNLSSTLCGHVGKSGREGTPPRSFGHDTTENERVQERGVKVTD